MAEIISPPERTGNVYHYTNAQGLLGILQSGSLRASHFLAMNDFSEVRYAIQVATQVIDTVRKGAAQEIRDSLFYWLDVVQTTDKFKTPYLACFCDRDNLLSQWREYGAGGDGFALGFDKQLTRISHQGIGKRPPFMA